MFKLRRIVGHSMEPAIRNGQLAIFIDGNYRKGDIVLAEAESREVVKRAISTTTSKTYLAGNRQVHDVGWVANEQVKARLVWPRT